MWVKFSNTDASLLRRGEPSTFSAQEAACLHSSSLALKTWRGPGEAGEKLASEVCEGLLSSNQVINASATGKQGQWNKT